MKSGLWAVTLLSLGCTSSTSVPVLLSRLSDLNVSAEFTQSSTGTLVQGRLQYSFRQCAELSSASILFDGTKLDFQPGSWDADDEDPGCVTPSFFSSAEWQPDSQQASDKLVLSDSSRTLEVDFRGVRALRFSALTSLDAGVSVGESLTLQLALPADALVFYGVSYTADGGLTGSQWSSDGTDGSDGGTLPTTATFVVPSTPAGAGTLNVTSHIRLAPEECDGFKTCQGDLFSELEIPLTILP